MLEALPPFFSPLSWQIGCGRGLLLLLLLSLPAVHAHDHPEEISEEMANAPIDAILWIHMFLQASIWGILFPIGMVLGLSRSRWHVPLQVRYPDLLSLSLQVELIIGRGHRAHARRLHPRARPPRSGVPYERTRRVRQAPPRTARRAVLARGVSQTAHTRTDAETLGRARAWRRWKVVPGARVDTDAVWRDRVWRVLSG
jgi:hypothetical protein